MGVTEQTTVAVRQKLAKDKARAVIKRKIDLDTSLIRRRQGEKRLKETERDGIKRELAKAESELTRLNAEIKRQNAQERKAMQETKAKIIQQRKKKGEFSKLQAEVNRLEADIQKLTQQGNNPGTVYCILLNEIEYKFLCGIHSVR